MENLGNLLELGALGDSPPRRVGREDCYTEVLLPMLRRPSQRYYKSIMEMRQFGIPDQSIQAHIKEEWTNAGIIASAQGVDMHKQIELTLGGLEFAVPLHIIVIARTPRSP